MQLGDAQRDRFQVVQQPDRVQAQRLGERRLFDRLPRQVGERGATTADRAGQVEAGLVDRQVDGGQELPDDRLQRRVLGGRIGSDGQGSLRPSVLRVDSKDRLGAADVTGQEQAACRERDCTRHPMRFLGVTHRSLGHSSCWTSGSAWATTRTTRPVITDDDDPRLI